MAYTRSEIICNFKVSLSRVINTAFFSLSVLAYKKLRNARHFCNVRVFAFIYPYLSFLPFLTFDIKLSAGLNARLSKMISNKLTRLRDLRTIRYQFKTIHHANYLGKHC